MERKRLQQLKRKIPKDVSRILDTQFRHMETVLSHPEKFPEGYREIRSWLEKYRASQGIDTQNTHVVEKLARDLYASEVRMAQNEGRGGGIAKVQTPELFEKYKKAILEKAEVQKQSLRVWGEYLSDAQTPYPLWFRYYVLYSLGRM